MSNYRRWYSAGGTYFFTVVAYARRRSSSPSTVVVFCESQLWTCEADMRSQSSLLPYCQIIGILFFNCRMEMIVTRSALSRSRQSLATSGLQLDYQKQTLPTLNASGVSAGFGSRVFGSTWFGTRTIWNDVLITFTGILASMNWCSALSTGPGRHSTGLSNWGNTTRDGEESLQKTWRKEIGASSK